LNFYIPLGRLHGIIQQAKILRLKADHVVVHQGDVGSWYVYVTSAIKQFDWLEFFYCCISFRKE